MGKSFPLLKNRCRRHPNLPLIPAIPAPSPMELSAPTAVIYLMLPLRHLMTRPNNLAQDPLSSGQNDPLPFYRGGPRRFGRISLAIALALLATWMLWSFLPAIAWACVLAIATRPLYSIANAIPGGLGQQSGSSSQ